MQNQLKIQRQKIESYTDDLERAVEERTKQLETLQKQLLQSQKMESLGTLSSGIAHDFNNLLTAILGYASFVKEEIEPDHPHYRYWDIVEQACLRGTELTGHLMTFSGGRVELDKKKAVNLNQIIEELVRLLSRTFTKAISFEVRTPEEKSYVLGDGNSIYQSLMNICINARDSMPLGGQLIIEMKRLTLSGAHLQAGFTGNFVEISISDTGSGMKKEVLNRVFEPFFTTKAHGRGTGLGLSIVYGIIQKHHGFINVFSEEGKGTTFKIYLPLTEPDAENETKEVTRIKTARPGRTILVVDDEEPLRNLCAEMLSAAGYKVLTAADGSEAVNIFSQDPAAISLVILDMVMPGISGHETFRRLKAVDAGVKVVISSGFSPNMGINWADEDGVMGVVQKPYRSRDMLAKISEIIP